MRFDRYVFWSLVSGVGWGVLAALISTVLFRQIPWGGVVASPLIGLLAGLANRPVLRLGFIRKALFAAVSVFLAAALFGLATGVGKLIVDGAGDLGAYKLLAEWIRSALFAMIVFWLWVVLIPLAILNQHVLGVIDRAYDKV